VVLLLKPSFIKDKSLHDNDIQTEVTKPDQDDNIMTDGLIVA
jgi:predicted small lipoprotein YifL